MKFCVLQPTHQHIRKAHHHGRLQVSKYFGLKIVLNELETAFGIVPDFVEFDQVHKYDVILCSILSIDDYFAQAYTFYRKLKGKRSGIWIAGGSAVQNIPPLLEMFDFIFVGRAEGILKPFFSALLQGNEFRHDSIVNSSEYNPDKTYRINYVEELYKADLGKEKETMLGCKYNCAYCRYRISSKPPNMREKDRDTTMPGNEETFWELELSGGQQHTTSLDGLTEGLRRAVTKHITDEAIIQKFRQFSGVNKVINLKIYLIVGYPHNPQFDFTALHAVLREVDSFLTNHKYHIKFHMTPFSAEPGTPMQWERVNIEVNYNSLLKVYRKKFGHIYDSSNLQAILLQSTMSNFSVLKRAIHHRADVEDLELIRYISSDPYFRSHDKTHTDKIERLLTTVDCSKFVKEYPIGSKLSSSNVKSWRSEDSIIRQGQKVRRKLKEHGESYVPGEYSLPTSREFSGCPGGLSTITPRFAVG